MTSSLSTRRRGDLSRELQDFFAHEPGAPASNFAGIAALALSGVRTSGGNPFGGARAHDRMQAICGDVGRHEAIRRALRSIDARHQEALWLAFGPHRLPPEAKKALGETAGAAILTDAAREACRKASGAKGDPSREQVGAWLRRACVAGGAALGAIAEERDAIVEEALAAYAEARGEAKARVACESVRRKTPIKELLGL